MFETVNGAYNTSAIISYFYSIPDEAVKGNIFAIVFLLIILYIAIYIIQKLTTLLVFVLKKVFLLIIVALAFYEFIRMFTLKLAFEGFTTGTIIFGAAGFVIGVVAFSTALYVALHSIIVLQKSKQEGEAGMPEQEAESFEAEAGTPYTETKPSGEEAAMKQAIAETPGEAEAELVHPSVEETELEREEKERAPIHSRIREELSVSALKSDKRIGAVVAYIIIAEFGVFSSKTIAAPSIETGFAFFAVFIIASLIFVRLTYHDYWKGMRHLTAAILIGGFLSILLGFFWGGIPLEQLFSLNYFASDALVALVTGLALSLFMGSIS